MTNLSVGTSGSATDVVVSRAAGTGPATWSMGMLFERRVGAEETAGLLGASIVTQPPGQASPLHVHTREAEAWFLLQGAMTYRAGERLIRMTAGDFIYLPREIPHAFRTTGTVPVRFLALTLPGGLLDIYDEGGIPAAARRLPDGGLSASNVVRGPPPADHRLPDGAVPDAGDARWLDRASLSGCRGCVPPIP